MSKFKEEELLEYFDDMCLFLANHHWTKRDKRAVAIRELIKNQPEVTEEFVEKMVDDSVYVLHKDKHEFYKNKLKEAGVEVKEKK